MDQGVRVEVDTMPNNGERRKKDFKKPMSLGGATATRDAEALYL